MMRDAQRERSTDTSLSGSNAFLGSATAPGGDATFRVHALCWPIVPVAWHALVQTWESVGGWRTAIDAPAKPQAASWIAECAPQLGSPFRGTTAEESTIAAILTRTAMSVAVAVVDEAQTQSANQREGWLNCLSSYDNYINAPGRNPCRVLVLRSGSEPSDRGCADAFAHSRQRLPNADWLQRMELRSWSEPLEPLPLEAAHVIATSVARYRADRETANPIVDAVRAKLAHPLELLDRLPKKRR